MIPHILFDPDVVSYWPDPPYWNVQGLTDAAPRALPTSGITQPSVAPLALLTLIENAGDRISDADALMREFYPQMLAFHRYLLTARDPEDSGLVSIVHPWESGLDNSPAWDAPMSRIHPRNLPPYRRRDLDHVDDPNERPTQETYDRYVHLCEQFKRVNYNDEAIYAESDFLIKDPPGSVLLYLSNAALIEIAGRIGEDAGEIDEWMQKTRANFDKYFRGEDGLYYPYDVRADERIKRRTVMCFLPLALDFLSDEQLESTIDWLGHSNFCGECNCDSPLVPSSDVLADDYSAVTYWRGPVWVNVNWLITLGLYRRGHTERADACFEGLLALAWENGFWEFYRPDSSRALGGRDFSWSAALTIDLLRNPEFAHPSKEQWRKGAE
jgi:hypothetical protein